MENDAGTRPAIKSVAYGSLIIGPSSIYSLTKQVCIEHLSFSITKKRHWD